MSKPILVLALLSFCLSANSQEQLDVLTKDFSFPANSQATLMRGQFRPVHFSVLSAGIDGKLSHFSVRNGSMLKDGDLIARFACDQHEYERQIAIARAKAASKNFEVNTKLDAYQNISELDLAMSEAELAIAEAEANRANAVLKECRIVAPFNATVTEKLVQAHQYMKKGDPLLEIVGTDNLEIEMVLPSLGVLDYIEGRRFTITVDETGVSYPAEIVRVVNVVDPVSQTIRVIGRLVDSAVGLMPGMSGVIELD